MSRQADPPFTLLWRVFVEQFAANESATSDLQTRRAIIGVITFLIVPGLFLMMKTLPEYEILLMVAKARNMPQLIEIRLAQLAVLFVSYSMSTTGLLTVFIWDALVFDKRDAMVLGPLPLRGSTIVSAKLAALATFLVGTALAVNITSGVPFGFVTGGPAGHILRHLAGHLSGTIGGAVFVFSTLVIVRGLLVLLVSAHAAATVGSFLQFLFLSGVLCFMMVPTAIGQVIPPISWFAALFELIRGSRQDADRASRRPGAPRAAAVGRRRDRRHLCRVLAANARGARAVCASRGKRPSPSPIRRAPHRPGSRCPRDVRFRAHDTGAQSGATGADRDCRRRWGLRSSASRLRRGMEDSRSCECHGRLSCGFRSSLATGSSSACARHSCSRPS